MRRPSPPTAASPTSPRYQSWDVPYSPADARGVRRRAAGRRVRRSRAVGCSWPSPTGPAGHAVRRLRRASRDGAAADRRGRHHVRGVQPGPGAGDRGAGRRGQPAVRRPRHPPRLRPGRRPQPCRSPPLRTPRASGARHASWKRTGSRASGLRCASTRCCAANGRRRRSDLSRAAAHPAMPAGAVPSRIHVTTGLHSSSVSAPTRTRRHRRVSASQGDAPPPRAALPDSVASLLGP